MGKILYFLAILIIPHVVFAQVVINEVMYNPDQCSDSYCEWVEIYNTLNESINLSSWSLCGEQLFGGYISHMDGEIYGGSWLILEPDSYAVITDGGSGTDVYDFFDINKSALSLHVGDATMCGSSGLSNSGGTVTLSNGSYSDIIIYDSGWGSDGNDYTLERIDPIGSNVQDNWVSSINMHGTPGYKNSVYMKGNIDYSKLKITEFLPDPVGDDDAPMPAGEWIELFNSADFDIDLKWLYFKDMAGHILYITDTSVKDVTLIHPNNYLVVYTNGKGGFLNNDGAETLFFYDKFGNVIDEISYDHSSEGNSYAFVEGVGWQNTKPTPDGDNINYNDVKDSYFKIIDVLDLGSDNNAEFGDTLRVDFNVYKGDTTKNSIKLYVENSRNRISKLTKATLSDKFTNYSMVLPIQIYPNCDGKYTDDDYYVKLGWTSESEPEDTYQIKIEGINNDNCDEVYVEKEQSKGTFSCNLVESPGVIQQNEEFEVKVELINDDPDDHLIDIYSYVYIGSKCYSGEREANKRTVLVKSGETKEVKLNNIVVDAEPGDYNLKIKAKRDDQKTEKQITHNLKILDLPAETRSESLTMIGEIEPEEATELSQCYLVEDKLNATSLRLVYESSNIKTKNLIPYLI
ncbi:MAG: lamin tail domain-containing protein, partial [Nanoarchaeota archaeon]